MPRKMFLGWLQSVRWACSCIQNPIQTKLYVLEMVEICRRVFGIDYADCSRNSPLAFQATRGQEMHTTPALSGSICFANVLSACSHCFLARVYAFVFVVFKIGWCNREKTVSEQHVSTVISRVFSHGWVGEVCALYNNPSPPNKIIPISYEVWVLQQSCSRMTLQTGR